MRRHWRLVKMALRASVWRATAEPPAIGLAGLAMWAVAVVVFVAGLDYATPGTRFSEYGLGLTIGELMLSIVATALVLRAENRVAASAALVVTSFIIVAATVAILKVAGALQEYANVPRWAHIGTVVATIAFAMIWLLGSYAAVVRSFYSDSRLRGWSRAGAAWAVQILVLVTFPSFPVFYTRDSHDNPPNLWSYARQLLPARDADAAVEPKRVDGARVELAQPALMEEAIARLAPQVRGETDVYAIGIAGWAGQDVFIKELAGALAALGNVLPVRDRTLRLVNHADTVERTPVALRANFAAAVRAVGRIMDKEEDVLLLFITSHGSPDGVALRLPGLISTGLAPEDVADVLEREGIRNRIVVVSACYSGVFVKPLANDNTIILTAADEKSSSFGCSSEREWTYFGDAFFNQNLRPDVSIEEAFLNTKVTIGQWEARDGLTSSNPQGHFGSLLMARLARIYGVLRQGGDAGRTGPLRALCRSSRCRFFDA